MSWSFDPFMSAVDIAAAIRDGRTTSLSVTTAYLDRISRFNREINAFTQVYANEALAAARAADTAYARDEAIGPLHGVPASVKDFLDVAGKPSTLGLLSRRHDKASRDALVVERLRLAGAILLGKTNIAARGEDYQTYNELYGRTNNPWDLRRAAGGSSGGSAAAVAAGLSAIEIGTDIAGSIRQPAAFCGVFGHRPTHGIVEHQGDFRLSEDAEPELDLYTRGPIARSAADLDLLLSILVGKEHLACLPEAAFQELGQFRVAIVDTSQAICPVDQEVRAAIDSVAEQLEAASARIERIPFPIDPQSLFSTFSILYGATRAAIADEAAYAAMLEARDRGGFTGIEARLATPSFRDWWRAHSDRVRQGLVWQHFFESYDILLTPITPTPAFLHDTDRPFSERTIAVDGVSVPYALQAFWPTFPVPCGLPATVFPVNLGAGTGLPMGLQAVGPRFADRTTIRFASLVSAGRPLRFPQAQFPSAV